MDILTGNRGPGRLIRSFVLGLLMLIPVMTFAQSVDEYEVKAAFLFNFTKFVEWPPAADLHSFDTCILGDDPFGSTIDRLTRGKTVNGLPIQVRRLKEVADAKQCQIVFVSSVEKSKAARLAEAVRGTRILTVGETEDFARAGGMVYLSMENSRVSLVINAAAAESSGLKVSAKLLALATIYKNEKWAGR
ncbi:MAG TPA: YfiR family protein [Terriglobia bacterium]|nr:YfiR family protein [Terriglobia bacterium]